jgi:hypothetical protein
MSLLSIFSPWTKWADILVFDFGGYAYLLQGRRNKCTGRSQFAVRRFRGYWGSAEPRRVTPEDLKAVGMWNPEKP